MVWWHRANSDDLRKLSEAEIKYKEINIQHAFQLWCQGKEIWSKYPGSNNWKRVPGQERRPYWGVDAKYRATLAVIGEGETLDMEKEE